MNELQLLTCFSLACLLGLLPAAVKLGQSASRNLHPWLGTLLWAYGGKVALVLCQLWVSFHGREDGMSYLEFILAAWVAWLLLRASELVQGTTTFRMGPVFLAAAAAGVSAAWFFKAVPFTVACLPSLGIYLLAHLVFGWRLVAGMRRGESLALSRWGWAFWLYAAWTGVALPATFHTRWYLIGYAGEAWLQAVILVWLVAILPDLTPGQAGRDQRSKPGAPGEWRTLAALLAQELRTPVAAIKTGAYVVSNTARTRLNSEEAEMLGMVQARSDSVLRILSEAQDLIRILEDQARYDPRPENLVTVLRQVCSQAQSNLRRRGISLAITLPTVPLSVDLDRVRMQQVLETLLGWSSRTAPNGGNLSVRLGSVGEFAVLEIGDAGPFLTSEQIRWMYEGGPLLEAGVLVPADGVAFRVARHVVEQGHGGLLGIASEPDSGTTFTLTLPLLMAVPNADALLASSDEAAPSETTAGPWQEVLGR
ncbi:MAG: HAMP domain-containing sensor histidine kinase [Candidatus Sericytochromatia bacterium]|nr:HAMP domain-containing sensor histidine kinase [Candidatus Sericytochromatia bacterium]